MAVFVYFIRPNMLEEAMRACETNATGRKQNFMPTSKAPVLRVNNNNDNFSIDVLYFVPENLKKVQESC